jgi:hypothetical protein
MNLILPLLTSPKTIKRMLNLKKKNPDGLSMMGMMNLDFYYLVKILNP